MVKATIVGGRLLEIATLVERCRAGDDLAWEALVRRCHGRVYSVAYHYLREADEARDMTQEIFIRVYRQLGSFRTRDRFLPWIVRVARNACIDRLRKRKARPPASDVRVEDGPPIASSDLDPEEAAARAARRRLLYRALDQLSERNREIILLKEIQGLKIEEISELLALPTGTVKSRASRARIELAARVRGLDPSYGT
jgi:RNA polymerase sigma-70 factor (ECF subfamily)